MIFLLDPLIIWGIFPIYFNYWFLFFFNHIVIMKHTLHVFIPCKFIQSCVMAWNVYFGECSTWKANLVVGWSVCHMSIRLSWLGVLFSSPISFSDFSTYYVNYWENNIEIFNSNLFIACWFVYFSFQFASFWFMCLGNILLDIYTFIMVISYCYIKVFINM